MSVVTCTNCGGPCSSQNEFLDWICDRYAAAGSCSPLPATRPPEMRALEGVTYPLALIRLVEEAIDKHPSVARDATRETEVTYTRKGWIVTVWLARRTKAGKVNRAMRSMRWFGDGDTASEAASALVGSLDTIAQVL